MQNCRSHRGTFQFSSLLLARRVPVCTARQLTRGGRSRVETAHCSAVQIPSLCCLLRTMVIMLLRLHLTNDLLCAWVSRSLNGVIPLL